MVLLNIWVLLGLLPLYMLYKKHIVKNDTRQTRLLYISLVFMFLAAARPALEQSRTSEHINFQDYTIALDASYSMQADDLKPSRYEVAKKAIKKLIALHPKDRFTIFIFTSNALLISPPTTDTALSLLALDSINPEYILTKSTSIKSLLNTVKKSSQKEKKLLVFSDGGEEHNLNSLLQICKKNDITFYSIAVASPKGAALKKDGVVMKDQYSSIIISRINPMLQELARLSGGEYYQLSSENLDIVNGLSDDISQESSEQKEIEVQHYKELFYFPLLLAFFLYFISVTKLHQLFVLPLLFLLPYPSQAEVFDFYYLLHAKQEVDKKEYIAAVQNLQEVTPSVKVYFNIASLYYKAGHYKKALHYFNMIQTKDRAIKQKIFYAMGNSAVKLKRYDRAKNYYLQALALGEDKDALYNLELLQKLHLKTGVNLIDMMPPKNAQTKKNSSKSTSQDKDDKKQSGGKKSSKRATQSKSGAGSSKKTKQKQQNDTQKKETASSKQKYKTSYKAYEIINKGYTNEKQPW
ncbi:MAG: VWA domain-containing protein [Sulfurimonas sp.]